MTRFEDGESRWKENTKVGNKESDVVRIHLSLSCTRAHEKKINPSSLSISGVEAQNIRL